MCKTSSFYNAQEHVSLHPRPGVGQVLWTLALFVGGALGAAAGGFGAGYLGMRAGAPAVDLVGIRRGWNR